MSAELRAQRQPEPAGLSDEELATMMPVNLRGDEEDALIFARAVEAATLARAQRQPVPPEPGEVRS